MEIIKLPIAIAIAIATLSLITACGGGGGSEIAVNPNYTKSVGDYFTYFYTLTTNTNVQSGYFLTRNYTQVNSDQSWVNDQIYSNNVVKSKFEFNSDNQELSQIYGPTSMTTCVNNPTASSHGPLKNLKVGSTWNLSYTRTCTGASPSVTTMTNKGSVIAAEPYTILGLTFDTYKLVYTFTEIASTYYRITNETCWRDKNFDVRIYCERTSSNYASSLDLTNPTSSGVSSEKLYAYSVAGFANNKPDVARYAGRWDISGSDNTSLSSIAITVDGVVTGIGTGINNKGEAGNIDKNGILNFTTVNGTTFSGRLTSGVAGAGTWRNATSSGSWTASHY